MKLCEPIRNIGLAVDFTGPDASSFRHAGLTTPQGMDPFLPRQYQTLIEKIAHFYDHRQADLDPDRESSLRLLGVRYFGTSAQGPLYPRLMANPHFQLMKPDNKYYKIFELADAQPAFGWEQTGTAEIKAWEPERRAFQVHSRAGGIFRLSEQNLRGWKATVDGRETPIEHCHDAFQCISLPAGDHAVEFRYRSRWLIPGAAMSLLSLFAVMLVWLIVGRALGPRRPLRPPSSPTSGAESPAQATGLPHQISSLGATRKTKWHWA